MTELSELPPPRRGARAGYYPDPLGGRNARWWDGKSWTLTVGPRVAADAPPNKALAPPTKVCPRCATEAETFAGECPNCGRSYTLSSPRKIAAIVIGAVVLTLGGCGACALIGVKLADEGFEEHSISRAEFTSVTPGTTRLEVEERFGDPSDTYRSRGATCITTTGRARAFSGSTSSSSAS